MLSEDASLSASEGESGGTSVSASGVAALGVVASDVGGVSVWPRKKYRRWSAGPRSSTLKDRKLLKLNSSWPSEAAWTGLIAGRDCKVSPVKSSIGFARLICFDFAHRLLDEVSSGPQ